MKMLSDAQMSELLPAEEVAFPSPVPTQIVSSDEYMPVPQTAKQKEVEARLIEMADRLAARQGVSRRALLPDRRRHGGRLLAMNEVYGNLFAATAAEAATPELAEERAQALKGQFIFDGHTHFLRDDTRLNGFVGAARRRRQGRLEQGAGGEGADPRRPQVRQLLQGDLSRQRHQGGADHQLALGRSPGTGSLPTSRWSRPARR